ncbi:hypothetical protein BKA62DRAFT_677128 [Auriculariales sp. MPI-PUGE-AT-0066]|nr:hypothetical protein BKA62DRAFT_677128 [Auriculariales sp. MPI-PUGE-AT-0066]
MQEACLCPREDEAQEPPTVHGMDLQDVHRLGLASGPAIEQPAGCWSGVLTNVVIERRKARWVAARQLVRVGETIASSCMKLLSGTGRVRVLETYRDWCGGIRLVSGADSDSGSRKYRELDLIYKIWQAVRWQHVVSMRNATVWVSDCAWLLRVPCAFNGLYLARFVVPRLVLMRIVPALASIQYDAAASGDEPTNDEEMEDYGDVDLEGIEDEQLDIDN